MVSLLLMGMFLSVQAENYPDRPNIEGWAIVPQTNLEVKVDDYNISSLGLVTEYRNPQDPNERVKVISRQIVILSGRTKDTGSDPNRGRSNLTLDVGDERHRQDEEDSLNRVHKSMDSIGFIRWHVKIDETRGQEIQDGMMEFWLMGQDGKKWAYKIQSTPDAILQTPVTEPSMLDNSRSIVVGLILSLGDVSQFLRLDQDELKPKEAGNVK